MRFQAQAKGLHHGGFLCLPSVLVTTKSVTIAHTAALAPAQALAEDLVGDAESCGTRAIQGVDPQGENKFSQKIGEIIQRGKTPTSRPTPSLPEPPRPKKTGTSA
ncbi:hypothetical protein M2359_000976 [Gordonia amarae]|uniref:Uncharacterized protein n=1 Tax=Gordonia amarae NBRC 15530 TaxID=1075090 RepID=G7GUN2_9ACTN|nr:hypothetical protein [Gordonia amarae]GAB07307.1 hypothetical protein GOAMR_63_01540 [Gordonia amarae NBRC 15530]